MAKKLNEYSDNELYKLLFKDKKTSEQAFAEIYKRHATKVFTYCKYYLRDDADAKDVFQETFIKLHTTKLPDRKMPNLAGFLIKISRNLCLNFMRDNPNNIHFEDYMENNIKVVDQEKKEYKNIDVIIRESVDLLPEKYKDIFILKEYEGFTYLEICEILGESIDNVKVLLYRAKLKLRTILEPKLKEIDEILIK